MFSFISGIFHKIAVVVASAVVTITGIFSPVQTVTVTPAQSHQPQVVIIQQLVTTSTENNTSSVDERVAQLEKEIEALKNAKTQPTKSTSQNSVAEIQSLKTQIQQLKSGPQVSSPTITFVNPSIIIAPFENVLSISGSDFKSNATVNLGNTNISVNSITQNLIYAKYAGDFNPGVYDVAVVNPDGGKFTLTNALSIKPSSNQSSSQNGTALSATEVIKRVRPATVLIRTTIGCGSGMIVQSDGLILTNYHVISDANSISVYLDNGSVYSATVTKSSASQDLALIKINQSGLPMVAFGDSSESGLPLGSSVVAIGFPKTCNTDRTIEVETGNITARRIVSGFESLGELLQTSARTNSGNSGGPLVDLYGNVIGVNTVGNSILGWNLTGWAFAIPSNVVKAYINASASYIPQNTQPSSPLSPPSGSVGNTSDPRQFIINGSGFCSNNPGASSIMLSGYPLVVDATIPSPYIKSWSDNQVTFVVPDSIPAGTYQITVRGYGTIGYCQDIRVSGTITIK